VQRTVPPQPLAPEEPVTADNTDAAVYYQNCAAARAAGAAPLHAGEPGYRTGLDRDGDGTACE
jgi:Excalibur calcium-binding domain